MRRSPFNCQQQQQQQREEERDRRRGSETERESERAKNHFHHMISPLSPATTTSISTSLSASLSPDLLPDDREVPIEGIGNVVLNGSQIGKYQIKKEEKDYRKDTIKKIETSDLKKQTLNGLIPHTTDDAMGGTIPAGGFRLRLVTGGHLNGDGCSRCPWLARCQGCVVPNDASMVSRRKRERERVRDRGSEGERERKRETKRERVQYE